MAILMNITIDGKSFECEEGKTILQVCDDNGIEVPFFCYHPHLPIAGNCRMCLVLLEWVNKDTQKITYQPVTACTTKVSKDMVVITNNEKVKNLQDGIMEFLLINHPLDCPECDQAGECTLQDYSYQYGKSKGDFEFDKVVKSVKQFGEHVRYWGSRCILCTRCVRFCRNISGTSELTVINRNNHAEIDIFPDNPVNNPLSLNIVDACPVGALVSNEFLYSARVWNLKQVDSICSECANGCNIRIDSLDNKIKRIIPRRNDKINNSWMCDHGRLNINYINSDDRLKQPKVNGNSVRWKDAFDKASEILKVESSSQNAVGLIISAWATNEEMHLAKKLLNVVLNSDRIALLAKPIQDDKVFPGFVISGDPNPNRNGAKHILGITNSEESMNSLINEINNKSIRCLIYFGGIADYNLPSDLISKLDSLRLIIALDHTENAITKKAHILMPVITFAEKNGTFINKNNYLQLINQALNPYSLSKDPLNIIQNLCKRLNDHTDDYSSEDVFNILAKENNTFSNLSYSKISDGILIG